MQPHHVAPSIALACTLCACTLPEYTRQELRANETAKHIVVSRDDLPDKQPYKVLGPVSSLRFGGNAGQPSCDQFSIARAAYDKFGSSVDAVIGFEGGQNVGNYIPACTGTAIQFNRVPGR